MNFAPVRFHAARPAPLSLSWSAPMGVALATLFAASADMMSGVVYWGMRGVAPERVFAAVARWVFDGPLPQGWVVSLAGLATLAMLYLPAVAALEAWGAAPRRTTPSVLAGAAWGLLTYVVLFHLVVPLIAYPVPQERSIGWVATCIAVHALVIGPVAARLIGRAHRH